MHFWVWIYMVFFLSQEESLSSGFPDKAPLNRAFLPPAEGCFHSMFDKQNLRPLPPQMGGRELQPRVRVSTLKVIGGDERGFLTQSS